MLVLSDCMALADSGLRNWSRGWELKCAGARGRVEKGGVVRYHPHWYPATFRELLHEGKYGAVIGLENSCFCVSSV